MTAPAVAGVPSPEGRAAVAPHGSWFADSMLVLASAVWGVSFAIIKTGVAEVDPLLFLGVRFGAGALIYWLVFLRRAWPTRAELVWGLLLGVLLCAGNVMQTVGLTEITPSRSAFLTSLNVLVVPFLVMAFWRQRIGLGVWMAIVLACAGLVVLYWTDAGFAWRRGDVLTLGCAVIFAGQTLAMSSASTRGKPLPLCGVQMLLAGVGMAALVPLGLHDASLATAVRAISPATWKGLAWLATIGTVLPFTLQATYQRRTTPARAAIIFSLEPVFATAFAAMLLGSVLTVRDAIGSALLLLAVAVAELRR